MDIQAKVEGRDTPLAITSYTVSEDATPLVIGSSDGGLGSMTMTGMDRDYGAVKTRSAGLIDRKVTLIDSGGADFTSFHGRGSVFGRINEVAENGPVLSVRADGLLSKLNQTVTALPLFGIRSTYTKTDTYINLATNPSLETATTNYTATAGTGGTAAVTRSTATYPAVAGTNHGRVTWSVAATGSGGVNYSQSGVLPGDQLYVRWSAGTSRAQQNLQISIVWLDGSAAVISTTTGTMATVLAGSYNEFTVDGIAPGGTASAQIQIRNVAGTGFGNWAISDILIFDALIISTADMAYFDGSFTNGSWTGTANASTSKLTITSQVSDGYDATVGNAFRYYMGLAGVSSADIVVDSSIDGTVVAFPGWEANLWAQLKALCAAYAVEMNLRGETIYVEAPYKRVLPVEDHSAIARKVSTAGNSATVEVVNQNAVYKSGVAYSADNLITVSVGQLYQVNLTIPHFLRTVANPVPLDNSPLVPPASGYYRVTDANKVRVSSSWWKSAGGSIKAAIDSVDGSTIRVSVKAPSTTGVYTGPFSIGIDGSPVLYIMGDGLFVNPETHVFQTAAAYVDRAVAPTIDNIFLSGVSETSERGVRAAQVAGGPVVSISGSVPYVADADGQDFGNISGSRIFHDAAWYRINSASISPGTVSFDAEMATLFNDLTTMYSVTFDEYNAQWAGATFSTYNTAVGTTTFDQLVSQTSQVTFDQWNIIYTDMAYNDHAVYPLLERKPDDLVAISQ